MDLFWEISGWEKSDKHLAPLQNSAFQRPFPFIPEQNGFYVIRGPRQVGKSCWLKKILSHHAKNKKCFYLSCEELVDFRELGELLRSLKYHDVVLLDEISFVADWTRAIKHALDSGYPPLLVVTGSHAHDLKLGADRMPGRFGEGGEFSLLPMDFDEFCQAREQAGWSKPSRLENLRDYFRIGGFPTALAESGPKASTPQKAMKTYWSWLVGDCIKLGKQELFLTELFIQLALTMQSPISLNTLAKKTSIGSHSTVQDYLGVLESCFALRPLYPIDIDSGAYRFRKERKYYFRDPLIYWIALQLSGLNAPHDAENQLAEMVAGEHLGRKFPRFGFHSNANGEVDFMLPSRWALEIKWSAAATHLSKTYLQLRIPEKIVWTYNNYLAEWPAL